jgi:hypothetical protein
MPRSLVSRSLEPLVAVLWGVFIVWSIWLAVVWIVPIGTAELGFVAGAPAPRNESLRRAVLQLADYADVIWLALATMNLHLILTSAHGLRTARAWLVFAAVGAFVLGALNVRTGVFFGQLGFGMALGVRLFGVALGWVFLWVVLVVGTREAVLWMRPRASHRVLALLTALIVLLTVLNLEWPARAIRGWWLREPNAAGTVLAVPWQNWLSWFAWPGLMAFAMREKSVLSGAAPRSGRAAVMLIALNATALVARLRSL